MAYLDRVKLQARNLSPLDVMNALDEYNVFLPTGDAKFGDDRLRHRLQLDVRRWSSAWATSRSRTSTATPSFSRDVATPKDASFIQTNIVRVNGRRAGLHPGLPPARLQHARRGQQAQGGAAGHDRPSLTRTGHRPEGRDGPVGLRPALDREPGGGGRAGGGPLLAGDPALPGRVADDGDRRVDDSRSRCWRRSSACTARATRST